MSNGATNFIDNYFIHKSLHANIEEMGRARFIVYALLFTSLFVTIYTISLEISDTELTILKKTCNILGATLGVFSIGVVKYKGDIKLAVALHLILGMCFVLVSSYYSGGIFTVDSFWFVLLAMISFMFVNRKAGVFMIFLCVGIYTSFYVLTKMGVRDFRADNLKLGLEYEYLNLIFLLLFACFLTYFYVNGLNRIRDELKNLKDRQVKNIDNKYRYITENANEIIALHNSDGKVTYVSPAVETILGFAPEELLGELYKEKIGVDKFVISKDAKQISCQNKNGKAVWLEITCNEINDEIGTGDAMISMAKDVTEKVLEDQKINQLREQVANDFHDEMGNKLAAITLNSNILSLKKKEDKEINSLLNKIEETSKALYQNSRDFIWSIDAKSDRLDEIFSYLRDFGEEFFGSLNISFITEAPKYSELDDLKMEMYSGRHIILIMKEAMTNAAKYSKAQKVVLRLSLDSRSVVIGLVDDGVGMDVNKVKKGKGIDSMKNRARMLGSELSIDSSAENGTKITLVCKLPKLVSGSPTIS